MAHEYLTFLGIGIAATVAVFGYLYTQLGQEQERLARTCAEALSAVNRFRFVPYKIRRRTRSGREARGEFAELVSSAQDDLDFYQTLLDLEAPPPIALSYRGLVQVARHEVDSFTKDAWTHAPVTADRHMNMDLGSEYGSSERLLAELEACTDVMRRHLRKRALLRRWSAR